jgi:hypothetical protein
MSALVWHRARIRGEAVRRGVVVMTAASLAAALVAGCGEEPPTPSTAGSIVGSITCGADGAHVTSPVVVQADGVHFIVTSIEDRTAIVGDGRGDEPDEWLSGPGQAVSTLLGTGTYEVGCRDGATDVVLPVRASLEIIDPAGLWIEDRVTCADRSVGINDYIEGAEGEHGDLVAAFRRHVTGLRPGDLVTPAGYPATDSRKVRIVRDGTVIAVGTYEQSEPGNWLLSVVAKRGSAGIGG